MSASMQASVYGVPVTFTAFARGINGVTIHPDAYKDNTPEDIANALHYAISVWSEYRDFAWVGHRIGYDLSEFTEPTKEGALENCEICQRAINSEIFPLDESQMEWAKQAALDFAHYARYGCYPAVPQVLHKQKTKRKPRKGYIYLIQAITPVNHYKIGLSKEPVTRIESMGVKLPFPVETIHIFPTDDMTTTEKTLHENFADRRVNGEWFELDEGDVDYICAIQAVVGGPVVMS